MVAVKIGIMGIGRRRLGWIVVLILVVAVILGGYFWLNRWPKMNWRDERIATSIQADAYAKTQRVGVRLYVQELGSMRLFALQGEILDIDEKSMKIRLGSAGLVEVINFSEIGEIHYLDTKTFAFPKSVTIEMNDSRVAVGSKAVFLPSRSGNGKGVLQIVS